MNTERKSIVLVILLLLLSGGDHLNKHGQKPKDGRGGETKRHFHDVQVDGEFDDVVHDV